MKEEASQSFDAPTIVRRALFFLLMLTLTFGYIFLLFRGLSAPEGMDQAQISRELSRNNGFTTKFIRPAAYTQSVTAPDSSSSFHEFRDTMHPPLNLLVNAAVFKIIDAGNNEKWAIKTNQMIYDLDRVVVAVSTMFFLLAIGVNYLLISRIFDGKIAGVTALLMLCCELMWNFSLSGLPQMLMLFLFSSAVYFVYRAVEYMQEGRVPMTPALLAGICFALLALTHWICVWILIAYLIYAAIAFRPRGIIPIIIVAITAVLFAYPMWRNYQASGSAMGTAFYVLYNGLGASEDGAMRVTELSGDDSNLRLDGLMMKIVRTTILQCTELLPFLGSIFAAPLFFVALLHPFKRLSIGNYRWAILLMWVFAALGMSIFGVSSEKEHANQIHILFAPIMTAYGLAILSILWGKLEFVSTTPVLRNAHLFAIVILSAAPLLIGSYDKIRIGLMLGEKGYPQWPPYYPPSLNKLEQNDAIKENNIIVSDQPWAVAWYADRMSIWLPKKVTSFEKLENAAASLKTPFVGILISPSSHGTRSMAEVAKQYEDFTALCIDGRTYLSTLPKGITLFDKSEVLSGLSNKYRYRYSMLNMDIIYYSSVPFRVVD